jgi:hypothetical protein
MKPFKSWHAINVKLSPSREHEIKAIAKRLAIRERAVIKVMIDMMISDEGWRAAGEPEKAGRWSMAEWVKKNDGF